MKVGKHSEENCCIFCHASSFLRTLILKDIPLRQKSQTMQSYTVLSVEVEIQNRHGVASDCIATAHGKISRYNKRNGSNLLTQVHYNLQNILMKSIPQQHFHFFHCPKIYQWDCTLPSKIERIFNIDSSFLVSFKRLHLETGDESE